jgi:uncharacterized membrane protein
MKSARQLKQIARDALKGKWSVAITTSFIATILGAGIWEGGSSFSSNNEDNIYTDFFNKFTQSDQPGKIGYPYNPCIPNNP